MEGYGKNFRLKPMAFLKGLQERGLGSGFFFLFSLLGCLISYFKAVVAGALLTG